MNSGQSEWAVRCDWRIHRTVQVVRVSGWAQWTSTGLPTVRTRVEVQVMMSSRCKHEPFSNCFCILLQPSSVHRWTSAFLLAVHGLCGVTEGRWSHFLGWQSVISQAKIPWNTPPWLGIEPGPWGGQTVNRVHLTVLVSIEKISVLGNYVTESWNYIKFLHLKGLD